MKHKKKMEKYRKMSMVDLLNHKSQLGLELGKLLAQAKREGGETIPEPSRINNTKRDIARIKTILREREL